MDEITDDCVQNVINILFYYHNETKLVPINFLEHVNNTMIVGQVFTIILTHFNISFNLSYLFLSDLAVYNQLPL